jgi:type I restriction enzyme S subunit
MSATWQTTRLKFVAPSTRQILPARLVGARYIGLENIESGTGKLLLETEQEQVDSSVVAFDERSVLFGKLRPYLAKVATPDFRGVASTEIMVFEPVHGNDRRFLSYSLLSDGFITRVSAMVDGAKMPRANPDDVLNLRLAVPPPAEQRRIAAYLDEATGKIDRLVRLRRRQMELLREQRAALIQQAVTRGLNPNAPLKDSGIPWLGQIPRHWEVKRLKYLCNVTTGGKDTVDAEPEGEFPFFVRSQTVERINSYSFDGEAVLTAGDGVGVGKVFHYYDGKLDFHQRVYLLHNFHHITGKFFFQYLRSLFHSVALGGQAKSTVDSLRMDVFLNFEFCIPPATEQAKILECLEQQEARFDSLLAAYERQIALLVEYRASLIHESVTGQRGVPAGEWVDRVDGVEWEDRMDKEGGGVEG